jgi:hypothetical protein
MTESGTGWPDEPGLYKQHANVKLTEEQLTYIETSGEATSTWIREAVEDRINKETKAHLRAEARKILLRSTQRNQ